MLKLSSIIFERERCMVGEYLVIKIQVCYGFGFYGVCCWHNANVGVDYDFVGNTNSVTCSIISPSSLI